VVIVIVEIPEASVASEVKKDTICFAKFVTFCDKDCKVMIIGKKIMKREIILIKMNYFGLFFYFIAACHSIFRRS